MMTTQRSALSQRSARYDVYGENEKLATLWTELSWSHHRRIMSPESAKKGELHTLREGADDE